MKIKDNEVSASNAGVSRLFKVASHGTVNASLREVMCKACLFVVLTDRIFDEANSLPFAESRNFLKDLLEIDKPAWGRSQIDKIAFVLQQCAEAKCSKFEAMLQREWREFSEANVAPASVSADVAANVAPASVDGDIHLVSAEYLSKPVEKVGTPLPMSGIPVKLSFRESVFETLSTWVEKDNNSLLYRPALALLLGDTMQQFVTDLYVPIPHVYKRVCSVTVAMLYACMYEGTCIHIPIQILLSSGCICRESGIHNGWFMSEACEPTSTCAYS